MRTPLTAAALGLFLNAAAALAADTPGSKDPDFLKRITGSEIIWQKNSKFDELTIALEKVEFDYDKQAFKKTKRDKAEGRLITTYYKLPSGATTLEAIRQYQAELKPAGYETLFTGQGEELDDGYNRFVSEILPSATKDEKISWIHQDNNAGQRYAVLKGAGKSGSPIYVSLLASLVNDLFGLDAYVENNSLAKGDIILRVDVLETQAMENRMSVVKAAEMTSAIDKTGRIALYGILFDTDKATLKAESDATLAEMASLLKATPGRKFLIVGHTDNQGGYDYNTALSKRRAEAVVAALASQHGIDRAQIIPVGVGMAAPVASNTEEPGRAKNRRVEIVAM